MTNLTETSREEMERVVIGRGSTCELEFHISHPRTVLSWEFVSTDYDISFGWFTKEIKTRKLKSSKILKEIVSDHAPHCFAFLSLPHHNSPIRTCINNRNIFDFRFQRKEPIVT